MHALIHNMSSPLPLKPLFRIQVLFENEPGTPTKEFKAGDLHEPTFDALVTKAFAMSFPNEDPNEYMVTFKYHLEEMHESRWVQFETTEFFGYAIQSNEHKGYIFLSTSIVKKGAVASLVFPPPCVIAARSTKGATKPKVAKKTKTTKAKAPSRGTGPKIPVDQKILSALKERLDLGISAPLCTDIGIFCGFKNVRSETFSKAIKKLEEQGLIERPSKDTISLTQAGIANTPATAAPATSNEEVQERLKKVLKGKGPAIFDLLIDGLAHTRQRLAADVGHSNIRSEAFVKAVNQMESLNMVEFPKDDKDPKKSKLVRLTDLAFPFGRPKHGLR